MKMAPLVHSVLIQLQKAKERFRGGESSHHLRVMTFDLTGKILLGAIALALWLLVIRAFTSGAPVVLVSGGSPNRPQVLQTDPNYLERRLRLAIGYGQAGFLDEAVRELQEIIAVDPKNSRAHYNLGVVYAMRGMYDEAIEANKQALRLDPSNAEAHNNLGAAYGAKAQFKGAISEYRQALRLNPRYAEAQLNLGSALMRQQQWKEAIQALEKALEINPNLVAAHSGLAQIYSRLGQGDKARRENEIVQRLLGPQQSPRPRR
ncbi:MAG: tetratricopeptide repeat protein [Candidatus Tectomicrobia bacterium]|uniref:Tetratricopeptide repeat protein n=1 Tax=Tectimicrobiota bacterium TaxID=2528274 RepID=A0A932GM29_UNCTE|nr:tetratricopeptide repeat protein [Candidatus Tectomicrobia bacterium]